MDAELGQDSEWMASDAVTLIKVPDAADDKYSRGVLGVMTGSADYPGAAVLSVEAAFRTGIGMVRYIGVPSVAERVLDRRPEVVTVPGRVQAWLLGSGVDVTTRSPERTQEFTSAITENVPVVLDAGALDLVRVRPANTVITPHARELAKMLIEPASSLQSDNKIEVLLKTIRADPAHWAARTAHMLGVTVLLKGSVTYVADPQGAQLKVTGHNHWLATAGTGDVLGGIIGALFATNAKELLAETISPAQVAATAAYIHNSASQLATETSGGGPITALDVAAQLPRAIGFLLKISLTERG